jgi:outer membrane lipoprotein-sorting protein
VPGAKGAVLVYDGQKVYAYDPADNTVYTATPDKMLDKAPDELKAILQNADVEKELDKLIDASDIKLSGTEKVAGLDAYKLDITLKPDAAQKLDIPQMFQTQAGMIIKDLHATLWVDTNRWIPLKLTLEHPNMGQFTSTTSNIELNKPIDASKFVLQVPSGAKTVDLDALHDKMGPKSTTLLEAKVQAKRDGWKLLEPQYLPSSATLIEVLSISAFSEQTGNRSGVVLNYSSPTADFSIIEGKSKADAGMSDMLGGMGQKNGATKQVDVRGVKATAVSLPMGNRTALVWQEKDTGIWVAIHGKLSLDEAVKIAEGLK